MEINNNIIKFNYYLNKKYIMGESIKIEKFNKSFFENLKKEDFENWRHFYFQELNLFIFQLITLKKKNKYCLKYTSKINIPWDKYLYELSNTIQKDTISEAKEQFLKSNSSFEVINKKYQILLEKTKTNK